MVVKSVVVKSLNLDTRAAVESAVAEALRHPRAVVFVHVDWGIMQPYRETFEQFANDWTRRRLETPVSFHYIDFTSATDDYSPITKLPGWIETRKRIGREPFNGSGEYAWIINGRLVDIGSVGFPTSDELIRKADHLFLTTNGDGNVTR